MKKANSHMHDYKAHATSLGADMEYYYAKRLLPLALQLFRKRQIELYDLAKFNSYSRKAKKKNWGRDYEVRLRSLEDQFDDFVRGINRIAPGWGSIKKSGVVTNDVRTERGDYDPFFHITAKERRLNGRNLSKYIDEMESDLSNYEAVLNTITTALSKLQILERTPREKPLSKVRPSLLNGAKIVARAWKDPLFKKRLLQNARQAVRELSIPPGRLGQLHVVENSDDVHNVIVCTLCSCYPYDLLGNAPWWYKQDLYKTKIISDPRGTLESMFKLKLPQKMKVRVHDSTSDVRYMVLPRRPTDTEDMDEEELTKFVSRESLIGVSEPTKPNR